MAGTITPIHNGKLENDFDLNHFNFTNDDGVTTFVRLGGTYSNPGWITALAWSKITGTPSSFTPSAHANTHASLGSDPVSLAASQITSGTIATTRLGSGAANSGSFLRGDQTWATVTVPTVASTSSVLKGDGSGNAIAASAGTDYLIPSGNGSGLTALTAANITNSTTAGRNVLNLTNPGAITFPKFNADNTVTAEAATTHRTSIGATTVGGNLFTLTNPSAITFLQLNADNTVTVQSASAQRTALSLVAGTNVQAWDADLDLWAATTPPSSYAVGDILYASGANTISKLTDVAAGRPLLSGGVTTAPAYAGYTFSGTASQTYTFPSTSATLARTDAANTFTGHQTIEGVTSTGATGTGKFVFDTAPILATNLSVGGTAFPSNYSGYTLVMLGATTSIQADNAGVSNGINVSLNASTNSAGLWKYLTSDFATNYTQVGGVHYLRIAASGTAGNTITWTNALTVDVSGNLNIAGTLSGSSVSGGTFGAVNGSALTALTAANITNSTTVGRNILNLTNPGAITFLQVNADNTVTAQSASVQRTALGLAIGTNVQAWDTDLDVWAGITPASGIGTFLATPTSANLAAALTDENGSGKVIFASGTLAITSGKTATFNNTLSFSGTDSTTMTFPSTSATIARTDAANTFTGHQTIEGVTSTGATGTGKFVFDNAPTFSGLTKINTANTAFNGQLVITDPTAVGSSNSSIAAITGFGNDFSAGSNTGRKWYIGTNWTGSDSDLSVFTTLSGTALSLGTNGTERVRIDSSRVTFTTPAKLKSYTVSTLPAGSEGDIAYVTDALAPTFLATVVGGGTVKTQVFYNGSNWVAQ